MKFEIICTVCGSDDCYIDVSNIMDISIDGDLIDGESYYKVICPNCDNSYISLDDDDDYFLW